MYSFLRKGLIIFVSDEVDKNTKDNVMMSNTKLLLALLLVFSLPQLMQAQGWTRTIDKLPPTETALKMVSVADGHIMVGPTSTYEYFLLKVDSLGQEVWYNTYTTTDPVNIKQMKILSNGDVVVFGIISPIVGGPAYTFIAKHDAVGNRLWFKNYFESVAGQQGYDMVVLPDDTLVIAGHYYNTALQPAEVEAAFYKLTSDGDSVKFVLLHDIDTLGLIVTKAIVGHSNNIVAIGQKSNLDKYISLSLDYDLNLNWQRSTTSPWVALHNDLIATSDGGYMVASVELVTDANGTQGLAYLYKLNGNGFFTWAHPFGVQGDYQNGKALMESSPGVYAYLITALVNVGNNVYSNGVTNLVFVSEQDGLLNSKVYKGATVLHYVHMNDMVQLADKGFLMCGGIGFNGIDQDIYLIRTDSLGGLYKSVIRGNIFGDFNENCQFEVNEPTLKNWIVTATGVDSFFGISDLMGNYEIECDTGTYTLKALTSSPYWTDTLCHSNLTATVVATTDTVIKNIPVGKIIDCPAMKVSVDAPFLRRCLPGPAYVVNYCNNGTAESPNTYVVVSLETDLILDSANITYTALGNNEYRFDVGTVGITDCGKFLIYVRVDCAVTVFSQTHCVDAHIFPNAICTAPNPLWDGVKLDLTTDCQPDSLAFMVKVNGANMLVPKSFTIIQDDVMYVQGNFQFNSGATFTYKVPSNGSTWTFITEQTPYFPGNRHLVSSVEGCGTNTSGVYSLGYLVQFPQIGPDPSAASLCLIDRASIDPNDKTPTPKGLGLEGTIDKTQALNYRIRFQNTGTDTAFRVVVLDTLSGNLDLLSIRNVRSSHPMQMSILPDRILQVVYTNILLPDSNVNELASHGFVSFEIDLVADLATGTQITNTAYIYFDQNTAVITNTTLNTIGELYKTWLTVTDISNPDSRVSFYPNPTQGFLNISIEDAANDAVEVIVLNIQGQELLQQQFKATDQPLKLDMHHLPIGIYLVQVKTGSYLGVYRVVITH
ncbi:hypothetical protein BH09BAC1_BH09BAC1_11090 [soil metagenome]